jgi:hypothetical protein
MGSADEWRALERRMGSADEWRALRERSRKASAELEAAFEKCCGPQTDDYAKLEEPKIVSHAIGFFMGLVFAGAILVISVVTAIFSPWWGALGYTIAIYALFAVMAGSSWCIPVRKRAWKGLSDLEKYVLRRHRVFFYFPFGAANFGHFCNFTRIFAALWAIFCLWQGWYWLSGALAFFYALSTPMIPIWMPIPAYQACVARGQMWARDRLDAMQHILDERDALGF